MEEKIKLRDKLADIALQWQASFGVAPSITSSISEYDAAMLIGMSEKEYSNYMRDKTAVAKGTDFVYRNIRYQVKANRPSGKKGSKVTMVPKASNYEWDRLIWILYDKDYVMQEAWEWYMKDYKMAFENKKDYLPKTTEKGTACIIDNRKSWIQKTTKTNSFMIEKIMSKLGMVVLWCIVIIYGIVVITHICSDIIGVVVLVILAVVSIAFVLFAKRYKIWFKRRVKMLSTICEKSPDDSYIMPEEKFTESFDSANFFVQYKPETKEFFFCSYYYFIFPDYVETWSKAVKEVKALVSKEAPEIKVEVNSVGQLGKDFTLIMSPKDAKKSFLLSLAHLCIRLRSQLPCNNRILTYKFYFKIKVFDTICYGEFDGVRVSKAITISADGNYCVANVYVDSCFPEDFIKLNPPMSIILQYDLYSIETNMLVSKEEFDAHWEKCKDLCES